VRVRLDDGAVYAGSKSEIIRVDDEPPQTVSLAGGGKAACKGESEGEAACAASFGRCAV
jgi:hypothetical protein